MIQGTTSDAGKSTLVAGLCRLARRGGVRVAPFKPQNMALNSAVTVDGGEIGRAQALQAMAAGIAAHIDLNPVLLKPTSDRGAQVIIHGHAHANLDARAYHDYKPRRVRGGARIVCAAAGGVTTRSSSKGAGSPAEINLRERDIANMGFAERSIARWCWSPISIAAACSRIWSARWRACRKASGRAFAASSSTGFAATSACCSPGSTGSRRRPASRCSAWCLTCTASRSMPKTCCRANCTRAATPATALTVIVPALPRISNHTDFDALRAHPQVDFHYVRAGIAPPPADLIVLPGSKSVQRDLAWLRENGWDRALAAASALRRQGDRHLRRHADARARQSTIRMASKGRRGAIDGLGLLDLSTTLTRDKLLENVTGRLALDGDGTAPVRGYEIHMGRTSGAALARPAVLLDDGPASGRRGFGRWPDRRDVSAWPLRYAGSLRGAAGLGGRRAKRKRSTTRR